MQGLRQLLALCPMIINVVICKNCRWATCLLDSGEDLDTPNELKHERFGGAPGVVWGAKKQCEVRTK